MEDLERYADYNSTEDEDRVPSKHPIALIVRILSVLLILTVVGVIAFRLILFTYYPKPMRTLWFDEPLTSFYEHTGGNLDATTQKLRYPYDDEKLGNFFADHLIVIPGAGELQLALRYNVSALNDINEKYGTEYTADEPDLLTFRLADDNGKFYAGGEVASDALLMYRYKKLVFHDIVFFDTGAGVYPHWIRLEIFVKGQTEPYSYILVYENHGNFSEFSEYVPGKGERP